MERLLSPVFLRTKVDRRWSIVVIALLMALTSRSFADLIFHLPPTPEVLRSGKIDFFAHTPDSEKNNEVSVFYATRRLPAPADSDLGYGKDFDDTLRFGVADLLIGPKGIGWGILHEQTTTGERKDVFDLSLLDVKPVAELTPQDSLAELTPTQQQFIAQINAALDKSLLKDITVFVHGAFNSFYYAAAEAAQYRFFSGKQAVVLLYSWPAIGNHIAYGRNAKRAEQSETAFTRVIELLGRHSKAERINILAYSIGGRLVGGAMAAVADANPGDAKLEEVHETWRLGHLYLTASDEPMQEFVTHADSFTKMFDVVTVTVASDDPVLGAAEKTGGGARLGRPTAKSGKKGYVTEAERMQLEALINRNALHVINLEDVNMPEYTFAHGDWYLNPWVSSDVLVTLNLGMQPEQRGLESLAKQGLSVWYYPSSYPQSLLNSLLAYRKAHPNGPATGGTTAD